MALLCRMFGKDVGGEQRVSKGLGQRFNPGGKPDGRTGCGEIQPFDGADVAINHGPQVQRDAELKGWKARLCAAPVGVGCPRKGLARAGERSSAHIGARACGVFEREDRQHTIPDEFQHFAAMFCHRVGGAVEIGVQSVQIGLGVHAARQLQRPAQIGIEDCAVDLLSVPELNIAAQHLLAGNPAQVGLENGGGDQIVISDPDAGTKWGHQPFQPLQITLRKPAEPAGGKRQRCPPEVCRKFPIDRLAHAEMAAKGDIARQSFGGQLAKNLIAGHVFGVGQIGLNYVDFAIGKGGKRVVHAQNTIDCMAWHLLRCHVAGVALPLHVDQADHRMQDRPADAREPKEGTGTSVSLSN